MRHRHALVAAPWFWFAVLTMMLILTACPGGGKSGY